MKPEEIYTILEQQYFGEYIHEKDEIEHLPDTLENAQLFVDVGASLGQYTYYANKTLKNAKIIAIEADPLRFARLQKHCSKWASESTNEIVLVHGAVSDTNGEISFWTSDSNISGAINKLENRMDPAMLKKLHKISVPSFTLDKLLSGETEGGLIKVDVEGGEHRVLLGAAHLLAGQSHRFMVELHSWGDPSLGVGPDDTKHLFRKYLYDYRKLHNHYLFYPVPNRFHFLLSGLRRVYSRFWP